MIKAILACTHDGGIGQGDKIPWHHKGDLKRFAMLTKNNVLVMGVKTYLGLAKYYTKPGNVVLPNRLIIVAGNSRSSNTCLFKELEAQCKDYHVSLANVITLIQGDLTTEFRQISAFAQKQDVFIAGGSSIYDRYLQFAEKIHLTLISSLEDLNCDVKLTQDTMNQIIKMLANQDKNFNPLKLSETEGSINASYYELNT
jgi:dihydrofolate reductase